MYHTYFENGENRFGECRAFIRSMLASKAPQKIKGELLLCGGSAKAVLKYKNLLENKNNPVIGARQMRSVYRHCQDPASNGYEKMESILKERFRLVPAALAVFEELLDFYALPCARVSKSGVREGRLYAHLHKLDEI